MFLKRDQQQKIPRVNEDSDNDSSDDEDDKSTGSNSSAGKGSNSSSNIPEFKIPSRKSASDLIKKPEASGIQKTISNIKKPFGFFKNFSIFESHMEPEEENEDDEDDEEAAARISREQKEQKEKGVVEYKRKDTDDDLSEENDYVFLNEPDAPQKCLIFLF